MVVVVVVAEVVERGFGQWTRDAPDTRSSILQISCESGVVMRIGARNPKRGVNQAWVAGIPRDPSSAGYQGSRKEKNFDV
jgi:hypothetical protein